MTAMVDIKPLDTAAEAAWEAFVESAPDATFFHRAGWARVIAKAYGHPTYFRYASRGGRVVGVLPLVHVKSPLFGNALIATGFCTFGGIAAPQEVVAAYEGGDEQVRARTAEVVADLERRGRDRAALGAGEAVPRREAAGALLTRSAAGPGPAGAHGRAGRALGRGRGACRRTGRRHTRYFVPGRFSADPPAHADPHRLCHRPHPLLRRRAQAMDRPPRSPARIPDPARPA